MNRLTQLRDQIDACRPGSDDLALPELAELAGAAEEDRAVADEIDRSQRFDRAVSAALHDAAVPTGLLERVLAAAERERSVALANSSLTSSGVSRRWIVMAAGIAAVLLVGLTVALNWPEQTRVVAKDALTASVERWIADVSPARGWKAYTSPAALPTWCQIPSAVLCQPKQFRTYTTSAGESVVVFDCTPAGRGRVRLFVVKTSARYPVDSLPFSRVQGVSKVAVGAWQSKGLLFVLTVDEDRQRLDDFLRKPPVT